MPPKNSVKVFKENSFYHIYNRGVAKQSIYLDNQDFKTFLSYLKLYLLPVNLQGSTLKVPPSRTLKNYAECVDLISYCLMPNHFHFLMFQSCIDGIERFMGSLSTKYAVYFNKRYKRVGPLFQGIYKAVEVESEEQMTYLTKYIHRNPLEVQSSRPTRVNLEGYKYSSYLNYLGNFSQAWVKPSKVLDLFKNPVEYKKFVEEQDERDIYAIKDVSLDFE